MSSAFTKKRLVNIASVLILAFAYGFYAGHYQVFPYSIFVLAREAAIDVTLHWKSYTHKSPTRWLVASRTSGAGVVKWVQGAADDGLTLVSSLFDDDVALRLIDLDGHVAHSWRIRYLDIWSPAEQKEIGVKPTANWDAGVMGALMGADGSVVFTFNSGGLVKLDKCGKILWKRTYLTHHSVFLSDDDAYWVPSVVHIYKAGDSIDLPLVTAPFLEDSIIQVTESGDVIQEISVARLLFKNGLEALLLANGVTATTNLTDDYTHLNKVVVLQKEQEKYFPQFRRGDVMISLRNLNLIVVFDPQTEKIKWYQTGPWLRQHDVVFSNDGKISLFDNHTDNADGRALGGSRILKIDPQTRDIQTVYAGSQSQPFYSAIEGSHVYLNNGNILVSEAMAGRIFEVDSKGTVVWEFINRFDQDHVVAETHAYARYSRKDIQNIDWACELRSNTAQ